MHLTLPLLLLNTSITLTRAQVIFNTSTYTFTCPANPPNGTYCTGPSLTSNIIIRCTGTTGVAGNCNDNLAGVPPIGVKGFAACYQTSPKAGDAACSYNGTVYPDDGRPSFPILGSGSNTTNDSNNNNSNSSGTGAASTLNTTSPSTSTSTASSSPVGSGPTALADLANAPYPIANSTATATATAAASASASASGTGTGNAPDKTATMTTAGRSPGTFTGGAGGIKAYMGAGCAGVAALGLMLLLL